MGKSPNQNYQRLEAPGKSVWRRLRQLRTQRLQHTTSVQCQNNEHDESFCVYKQNISQSDTNRLKHSRGKALTQTIRVSIRISLLGLLVFGFNPPAFSQEGATQENEVVDKDSSTEETKQDPEEHKKDLESFEIVWNTIIETWWKDEDELETWEKQKRFFFDRVSAARSRKQVRKIQSELIKNLKASHYGIIPGQVYEKLGVKEDGKLDASQLGSVGLEF